MRKILSAVLFVFLFTTSVFAQTDGALLPEVSPVFLNANGSAPLANGFVCTFAAGTTTPQSTYSDSALMVANQNPIRLNAAGRPVLSSSLISVYLSAVSYKVNLYAAGTGNTCNGTSVGSLVRSVDNVYDYAQLVLAASGGATHIGYAPSPGNITTTVAAALNSIFTNVVNAQNFSGTDTFAKINAALASSICSSGCMITDGKSLSATETITSGAISVSGKSVYILLHGIYTYTGAAISGGIIQISGQAADGTMIACDGFPQNYGYLQINNVMPCGIKYTPASGTGVAMTLSEGGTSLVSVMIKGLNFTVNSNVTDVIQMTGTGGHINADFEDISIGNSATNTGWSGAGIALRCTNAGAAANAQYVINMRRITIFSNGTGINGGAGGTTSDGIVLDPTGGTGCGSLGPGEFVRVQLAGLTGSKGIYMRGIADIDIEQPLIFSNSFAANTKVLDLRNGSGAGGVIVRNGHFQDNDWANNNGVVDVYMDGATGFLIEGGHYIGGSVAMTHAEDHAFEFGSSTISGVIDGVQITNMETYGTVISTGASGIRYCGNNFTAGAGAAVEFGGSLDAMPAGKGCAHFSNATNAVIRQVNLGSSSGGTPWDLSADSSGHWKLMRDGATQIDVNGTTSTTFTSSPIIPFNTASGANVPLFMGASGTQMVGTPHAVAVAGQLSGGTGTISLTNNAVFSAAATAFCVATNQDNTNYVRAVPSTGSSITVTGTGTDHYIVVCLGY